MQFTGATEFSVSVCDCIQGLVIVPHSEKEQVIHRHEAGYLQQQLSSLNFQLSSLNCTIQT